MHTLGELLDGLVDPQQYAAQREWDISGVFDDSQKVVPGGLFVAVRGSRRDGREFVGDALARGARVIIAEPQADAAGPAGPSGSEVLMLSVPQAREVLARLAFRWYGLDRLTREGRLRLLGVTGTNGKTTTAFMTCAILRAAGVRCGMLGTVQYDLGARTVRASLTTPGALELAARLHECVQAGAGAVVMEVSSHALDQRRTAGLRFAAAAFTNLSGDHLDYHARMEHYAEAKALLFEGLDAQAVAVVNADDPAHERMLRDCRARVVRYGIDAPADLTARIARTTTAGTLYTLRIGGQSLVMENALVGRHNVSNALAATGLALALDVPLQAVQAGLCGLRNVPGRLQRVPALPDVDVYVDYAHTDDALRNVLGALRPLTRGRLIVVFGCGGERDQTKRPRMGRVAAELADAVVVTSDNPRAEDPQAIIEDILRGLDAQDRRRTLVEPDRRKAIHAALAGARAGDVVLIAGKGHEDYQEIRGERHHFDDVEVVIQAAAHLTGCPSPGSSGIGPPWAEQTLSASVPRPAQGGDLGRVVLSPAATVAAAGQSFGSGAAGGGSGSTSPAGSPPGAARSGP